MFNKVKGFLVAGLVLCGLVPATAYMAEDATTTAMINSIGTTMFDTLTSILTTNIGKVSLVVLVFVGFALLVRLVRKYAK